MHFRKNENILVEIICQQVELLQLFFNGDKIFRHLHSTDTIIYILKTIDHFILPFLMYIPKEKITKGDQFQLRIQIRNTINNN